MQKNLKILIVDDEIAYCNVLTMILKTKGYLTKQCTKPKEVIDILKTEDFDLIISDLIMPEMDGVELLKAVKKFNPDIYFIMLTAYGTIRNAVEAIKQGAFNYVIKGNDPKELLKEIQNISKLKLIQRSVLQNPTVQGVSFMMQTKNKAYQEVLNLASRAAKHDANILILGESGAGKEVIAQYIHSESGRSKNSFHATNCHIFSESLLESELFGHEKGSFTGALSTRIGRFEAARFGTLFLDEIGDIPLSTQSKLLRAIETKKINRIGSNDEIEVDFRLISATNNDLGKAIREGSLREDLFYRLSAIIIQIPPLRHRKEDLPNLIRYFVEKMQGAFGLEHVEIDEEVNDFLLDYSYPGNVRELINIIERMFVMSDEGRIKADIIPNILYKKDSKDLKGLFEAHYSLKDVRREAEAKYIENILKTNMFNINKSAKDLDISRRLLFYKISEYNIKGHFNKGAFEDEE